MHDKKHRILMLLENGGYPEDCRVAQEANALFEAGYSVSVICPTDAYAQQRFEDVDGVRTYRYPGPPEWSGVLGYVVEYGYSLAAAFLISNYLFLRHGFDTLHVHTPPDMFVTIGAWFKLFGVRYVMDHHDLSPELYQAQSDCSSDAMIVRILKWFEKQSCRLADQIIATNQTQQTNDIERSGIDPDKTNVVRNGPDIERIKVGAPINRYRSMNKTIIGYMGCIGFQDGVDSLLRALKRLVTDLNRSDFHAIIIGDGPALPYLRELTQELQLSEYVEFTGYQIGEALYAHIASCDIMATPDPVNAYNASCTMIKTMDYMAMSRPIVGYDMPEHRVSAGEASLYARPGDELHFAEALQLLMDDPELRATMGQKGRARIESSLAWHHQKQALLATYAKMLNNEQESAAIVAGQQSQATK